MTAAALLAALALAGPVAAAADEAFREVDYAKLERRIAKEPRYVAEPLYALFVLAPAGDVRMWAVLDKSDADLAYYDVLYLDLDADGDLTEEGERFVGEYDERRAAAGMALEIRVGDLPVPGTGIVHEDFRVSTVMKADWTGIWFGMTWRGEEEVSGGYGPKGYDLTPWGESPAQAPVLRPTALGPLSFGLWEKEQLELPIGGRPRLNVLVGHRGAGPRTLLVLDEHFLDLEQDALWVTVVAKGWSGEDVRERSRIRGHC